MCLFSFFTIYRDKQKVITFYLKNKRLNEYCFINCNNPKSMMPKIAIITYVSFLQQLSPQHMSKSGSFFHILVNYENFLFLFF